MYSETNQNLTACIVCEDNRWKAWGKLLSNRFNKVFVISSDNSYQELILEPPCPKNLEELPNFINVAFVHEANESFLTNITTKFDYIFKWTSSGTPAIKEKELPIYRKNYQNSGDKNNSNLLGVKSNDIEEVVAYITKQSDKEPSMCFPTLELYQSLEANTIEKRKHYLSLLSSLLKHYEENNKGYYQSIYQLMGSLKPIVYIFDDYNRYIMEVDGSYTNKPDIEVYIANYYCKHNEKSDNIFTEILKGFCLMLNNLSLSFTIKAPILDISTDKESYELICSALPLTEIDRKRSQIAAFIVDLEWLPTPTKIFYKNKNEQGKQQWKKMGCYAIDILSQRYPEIPSFIFTGLQPSEEVQEALTHGASWGFQKEKTHHYSPTGSTEQHLTGQLNYINLEHQLVRAVNVRYGSYQTVPFPKQLRLDSNTVAKRQLLNKLGIKQLETENFQSQALRKLIAKLFPTADSVEPVKVLTSGKSQAQATFFVTPISQEDQLATRFIKIGSWFSIQKEYLAYQRVIQPRLNSYTANIIQKPILTEGDSGQMPWGALMYSLAGLPEDYNNLKSLHELFEQYMEKLGGDIFLLERLSNTLENVLLPFYQSGISKSVISKPLGYWLGDILPPLYTGVLIPLTLTPLEIIEQATDAIALISPTSQTDSNTVTWQLTSLTLTQLNSQLQSQREDCDKNSILEPLHDDISILEKPYKRILLFNWCLSGVEWEEGNPKEGSIILVHPQLGIRILLRGQTQDIRLRFGATWLRPNMFVKVLACLDTQNQEFRKIDKNIKENISIIDALPNKTSCSESEKLTYLLRVFEDENQLNKQSLRSPFQAFGDNSSLLYGQEIEGREGAIHGDLNLNNILYPANETVGWLIDFERVKEQGMIAFDLAKLEVEIWNHHLSPYIGALVTLSSSNRTTICYKLLYCALQALEFPGDEAEFFRTKVKEVFPIGSDSLLIPISNTLKVIKAIRCFGLEKCKLSKNELKLALAAYFFNSAKFQSQTKKFETFGSYSSIFAFIGSAWHLGLAIPHNYVAPSS
ncbi:MAG TPA: hypothetical protein DDW76_09445 [Cyanobacteria bacterium UBA11369]|nr:hypothetical protein [Cyanobacteria bacterium UBA11371]HBE17655.1 hypothetical protein [Cyanobacteria bacterium UBA11367]HBE35610.1 hypothetical protein [Cyanobacteria bacterium UBA11368]HBE49004.1 hypothetical protein [Cyanobacteria bacterium UBA11369]